MRFQMSYTSIYPRKPPDNIGLTYCKLLDKLTPLQPAALRSVIHLQQIM